MRSLTLLVFAAAVAPSSAQAAVRKTGPMVVSFPGFHETPVKVKSTWFDNFRTVKTMDWLGPTLSAYGQVSTSKIITCGLFADDPSPGAYVIDNQNDWTFTTPTKTGSKAEVKVTYSKGRIPRGLNMKCGYKHESRMCMVGMCGFNVEPSEDGDRTKRAEVRKCYEFDSSGGLKCGGNAMPNGGKSKILEPIALGNFADGQANVVNVVDKSKCRAYVQNSATTIKDKTGADGTAHLLGTFVFVDEDTAVVGADDKLAYIRDDDHFVELDEGQKFYTVAMNGCSLVIKGGDGKKFKIMHPRNGNGVDELMRWEGNNRDAPKSTIMFPCSNCPGRNKYQQHWVYGENDAGVLKIWVGSLTELTLGTPVFSSCKMISIKHTAVLERERRLRFRGSQASLVPSE